LLVYYILYYTQNLIILNLTRLTPLEDWRGPDVYRRLRLPAFKTVGT